MMLHNVNVSIKTAPERPIFVKKLSDSMTHSCFLSPTGFSTGSLWSMKTSLAKSCREEWWSNLIWRPSPPTESRLKTAPWRRTSMQWSSARVSKTASHSCRPLCLTGLSKSCNCISKYIILIKNVELILPPPKYEKYLCLYTFCLVHSFKRLCKITQLGKHTHCDVISVRWPGQTSPIWPPCPRKYPQFEWERKKCCARITPGQRSRSLWLIPPLNQLNLVEAKGMTATVLE